MGPRHFCDSIEGGINGAYAESRALGLLPVDAQLDRCRGYRHRAAHHIEIIELEPVRDPQDLFGHTLPDALYGDFRTTGLLHIIVISGWNISLLLQAVMVLSGHWLHRWLALGASLALVVGYTLFVGPSPPVVRAAMMGALFVVGQLIGRRTHAPTSLAAASLFMTLWNPLTLWSVSFQLSFAATLGLVAIRPLLERDVHAGALARPVRDDGQAWPRKIGELLLATIAAQIATLPLLWSHFGQVSIVSPLANLLVLPVQPAVMVLGSAATLVGALSAPLGRVAGWVVWPFTRHCIVVVQQLARLPWSAIPVPTGIQVSPSQRTTLWAITPSPT